MNIRSCLFAGVQLALGLVCTAGAFAQSYPQKPIRILVPYGSAGTSDVLARTMAQKLSEAWGQQIVVDNRPGASGIIAVELLTKAPADGYTILSVDSGQYAINPSLHAKLPYDPERDFTPVILAVGTPMFIAVGSQIPANNIRELIAYARANPGRPYGSSGNGTIHHLCTELFKSMAGVNLTHIPYKAVAQSVPALLAGDTDMMCVGLASVAAHAKAGKVRILGVGTAARTPLAPDVPTLAEAGVPGYEIGGTMGYVAPAGTPPEVVAKINGEMLRALNSADVRQRFAPLGIDIIGSTPAEFGQRMRSELQSYRKVVRDTGVRGD